MSFFNGNLFIYYRIFKANWILNRKVRIITKLSWNESQLNWIKGFTMNRHRHEIVLLVLAVLSSNISSEDFTSPCHFSEYGFEKCQSNLNSFRNRFLRLPLSDSEMLWVYGCLISSEQEQVARETAGYQLPEYEVFCPLLND